MGESKMKRPTIVEGIFYPDSPDALSAMIKSSILANSTPKQSTPFALIVPCASYLYANPIFSATYSQIIEENYDTVILISPVHKIAFPGIALTESDCFSSPLGDIDIDKEANDFLKKYNDEFIIYGEKYHLTEHSIEVQLPYLSTILGNKIKIVPIIMGEPNTKFTILLSKALISLIEKQNKKILFVVTTNLSHNQKYEIAVETDNKFVEILKQMNPDRLAEQLALKQVEAHGGGGVVTLLRIAQHFGIEKINILKMFNSGDVTDDKLKVEGYFGASV